MPDAIYTDPRLAAVYDLLNPPDASTAFYLDLAGTRPIGAKPANAQPKRVLDMGCGTGLLAAEMAARGHVVSGADPAEAMIAIARNRPGGDRVRWLVADAAGLDVPERFDLIVMTGHVFQIFLDDAAIAAALANLRRHLAPGGRLAFETRNPAVEGWRYWTAALSAETVEAEGLGRVDVYWDLSEVAPPLVSFETRFRFADGSSLAAPSTLRFTDSDVLEAHLRRAGFTDFDWYGDWDGAPLIATSPEIIVVAG